MRTRFAGAALTLALLSVVLCSLTVTALQAQEGRVLSKIVPATELSVLGQVRFELEGARVSESDLNRLVVKFASIPSGRPLNYTGINLRLDDVPSNALILAIRGLDPPNTRGERVKISIIVPTNTDSRDNSKRDNDVAQLAESRALFLDSVEAAAKARIAYTKTSRERNLYISGGFRGGEISANRAFPIGNVWKLSSLLNQIDLGLSLDKGSGRISDPDFLNVGVNFRKIFPLHRGAIESLVKQATVSNTKMDAAAKEKEMRENLATGTKELLKLDRKPPFFRAIVMTPLAPHLETSLRGHREGYLINFLNTSDLQIRTGTLPILGSKYFTWDMKLVPLALETGTVIRNPDDRTRVGNPLVRLNAGGSGKLTYNFKCGDDVIVNRIEFEMKGINRHLFNDESAFDPITRKADALVHGNKYAAEVDLRFVFGLRIPLKYFSRHPAITVTYKNGFFPPLYTYTNAVSVHFTLETDNDSSFKDMSVRVGQIEEARKSLIH